MYATSIVLVIALTSILLVVGVTVLAVVDKSMPELTGIAGMANSTMYITAYEAFNLSSPLAIIVLTVIVLTVIILIVGAFRLFRNSGVADET